MWKVLIVDDEPIIRRGLRKMIDWRQYDMEIIGEAADGEEAFEIAKKTQPNVVLVDICMPVMNGFQLIEKLNGKMDNWVAIIITDKDEFSYAYRAMKLKVFDYLLKPINKEQLDKALDSAKEVLQKKYLMNKQLFWIKEQLERHLPVFRKEFIDAWVKGKLTQQEIKEYMHYLKMEFSGYVGVLAIKNANINTFNSSEVYWEKNLLLYAINNITDELLKKCKNSISFIDENDCIIAITSVEEISSWFQIGKRIESLIEQYLMQKVTIIQKEIDGGIMNFPDVYTEIIHELCGEKAYSPTLLLAKSYIDRHYADKSLTLEKVASAVQASSSYLAKLFVKQFGTTFINYLTQVRIREALRLMSDHTIRVSDVAKLIGYSSQSYFCSVFKKTVGLSPKKYQNRIREDMCRKGRNENLNLKI
ncbi:MAG: response regulator [Clostridiaceae bacterium]|nr:response regulator [Clostridiaceae bacterium]